MGAASELEPLRPILERMLGRVHFARRLPSGTTGPSFLLETDSGRCVAKLFEPDAHALLGPACQFALLKALEATGIAPRPIACDDEARLLVTEYLENAKPLSADALRDPVRLSQLGAMLRRLHAVDFELPEFRPEVFAAAYLERIGGYDALAMRDRERYDELLDLAAGLDRRRLVPCHNDLLAENLLLTSRLRLIDFDYAVLAPPLIDLASVVSLNNLAAVDASRLLDAYFGQEYRSTAADFARVERLSRLVAHFWSLASAGSGDAAVARYRMKDD